MLKCFTKMHGAGNDFIIVEPQFFGLSNYRSKENTFSAEENQIMAPIIKETCRQKFGIGADGVLIVSSLGAGQFKMTVFNSDSSFGLMCGNGLRCVAAYLFDKKGTGNNFVVSTDSGDKAVSVEQRNPKLFWVSTFLGYPNNFKEH
jgi:diaminopimelate epimerase